MIEASIKTVTTITTTITVTITTDTGWVRKGERMLPRR
jgi:hypothetical protein